MTNPIAIRYNGQQKSTSDRPRMTIEIDYNYFWDNIDEESRKDIIHRFSYDESVLIHLVNAVCSYHLPQPESLKNNPYSNTDVYFINSDFTNKVRQMLAPLAGEVTTIEMDRLKKENQELQKYKKCLTDYMWAWRNYANDSVSYHQCREKMEELTGISLSRS